METLKQMCSARIAKMLDEDDTYHVPPLQSAIANSVLESVFRRHTEFPEEKIPDYRRVFRNATVVNWTFEKLNKKSSSFLQSLKLTELRLPRLLSNIRAEGSMNSDHITQFDFSWLFSNVLSPESCQRLLTLSVHGEVSNDGMHFLKIQRGSMQFAHNLRALKHLDVSRCDVSEDFLDICSNLSSQLTTLILTETNVKNLAGIPLLTHLEVLTLNGTKIENRESFMVIFRLKNLKKLSLVGSESENVRFFFDGVERGMVLQKLEFLNISKNFVTFENLKNLAKSHRKLATIGLVGIDLDFNQLSIDFRSLRILRSDTLPQLLLSIEYFSDSENFCSETLLLALQQLFKLVELLSDSELLTEHESRSILDVILMVMREHLDEERIRESTDRFLMIMCRFPLRLKIFTAQQRQCLTKLLLSPVYWRISSSQFHQISLWEILLNFEIYSLSLSNKDLIWDRAAGMVQRCPDPDSRIFQTSIRILYKYMFLIPEQKLHEFRANHSWKIALAEAARGFENRENSEYFLHFLFVLQRLLAAEEHPIVTDCFLTTLLVHNSRIFHANSHYLSEIFKVLVSIASQTMPEGIDEFFKEQRIMAVVPHIFNPSCPCYKSAIRILTTLYLRRNDISSDNRNIRDDVVQEIQNALENNQVTQRAKDWAHWLFTSCQTNNRVQQFLEDVVNPPPNEVYIGFYEI